MFYRKEKRTPPENFYIKGFEYILRQNLKLQDRLMSICVSKGNLEGILYIVDNSYDVIVS